MDGGDDRCMSRLWVEVQGYGKHANRPPHLRILALGHPVRPVEGDGNKCVLPSNIGMSRIMGD